MRECREKIGAVRTPRLIYLFGAVQALLYCTLLPLWEGIDEPFHYGYVQHLARQGRLPVLEQTPVSEEIERSLRLAPASHVVAAQIPGLTTFKQYFELPEEERAKRRSELRELPPRLGDKAGTGDNYEAQQPPLAYALLAPIEWVEREAPLIRRVWLMRVAGSLASVALLLYAVYRLGERIGIAPAWVDCAAFCLVSTQNWWCSTAHVANDWLSLPLLALLVLACDGYWRRPGTATALWLGAVLGAGLLAKSYFLLLAPLALAVAAWRSRGKAALAGGMAIVLAGWWYWRNLSLYDNLSGLQRATRSVGLEDALRTAQGVDWPAALVGMARGGLWSGNGSFTTFSAATLNVLLCLLAVGWALRIREAWRSRVEPAEWMLAGSAVAFTVVPVYAMLVFGSLYGRVSPAANSWYTAGLLPAAFLLCCAGLAGAGRPGYWAGRAIAALALYVSLATYWAKLIPLYAGFEGKARVGFLSTLYLERSGELSERLDMSVLGSGATILPLAGLEAIIAVLIFGRICRATGQAEGDAQRPLAHSAPGALDQERICASRGPGSGGD